MESDHVDQIKLIKSRQSHNVDKIKIFQIKLNIPNSSNSVEKMHVFIQMLIRSSCSSQINENQGDQIKVHITSWWK